MEETNLLQESFKIQKGEESYGYEYQNWDNPGTRCSCQGLHVFSRDKCSELERKVAGYLELTMECQNIFWVYLNIEWNQNARFYGYN